MILPVVEPNEFLPPVSRWTNRGGMVLLAIFSTALLLTNLLKYKTTVKAPIKIRPTGELRLVQAATEGIVSSINRTLAKIFYGMMMSYFYFNFCGLK